MSTPKKTIQAGGRAPQACATLLAVLLLASSGVLGQGITPPEGQKGALQQPPPLAARIPPLEFTEPLPDEPVAWLDGQVISSADLLRLTLKYNLSLVTQALAANEKLALELEHRGLHVDEKAVDEELDAMIEKMAPGKSVKDVGTLGASSLEMLRKQAWAMRGWKLLYWEQFKIPEDQRHAEMNPLILTIVKRQVEPNFDVRMRGMANGPRTKGAIVEIRHNASGKEAVVGANEALDFLMGLVKQGSLIDALDSIIDTMLVDREMEKYGVTVTDAEVAAYSAEEDAKYAGTIIPRAAILQQQGMTVDQDNERWRRIEAWKRIRTKQFEKGEIKKNDADPTMEELGKFLDDNRAYFMNEHKRVSQILVRTTDEVTGLPYPEDRQKELKERADLIYKKAIEGVDFGMLARAYSDDTQTARGDGRMAAVIKPRGGGLDPAFQKAAWELENVGDICKPVHSSYGWHIIKLDDHRKPARSEPDFTTGTHHDWLVREYDTDRMQAWLADLRSAATIKKIPQEQIFALKNRRYWSGKDLEIPK